MAILEALRIFLPFDDKLVMESNSTNAISRKIFSFSHGPLEVPFPSQRNQVVVFFDSGGVQACWSIAQWNGRFLSQARVDKSYRLVAFTS